MVDIVLFNADGSYGAPKYFVSELAHAFQKLGKSTTIIIDESGRLRD